MKYYVSTQTCDPANSNIGWLEVMWYRIAGKFGGESNLVGLAIGASTANFNSRQLWSPPKFCWMSFLTVEQMWSEVWTCKDRVALYKYFSQDGPTLPRKIMCESSTLTQKDLEKANVKVKRSIEREATKPQKAGPWGKYNDYTPQQRARMDWKTPNSPITVQWILLALWRNNEQAADILPCLTTVFLRWTATA